MQAFPKYPSVNNGPHERAALSTQHAARTTSTIEWHAEETTRKTPACREAQWNYHSSRPCYAQPAALRLLQDHRGACSTNTMHRDTINQYLLYHGITEKLRHLLLVKYK